ncbi:hypothetical protein GLOTRDRAFT_96086 [Gloeophyllum trabeum ATCC 11539]|uniref:Uncharacterized protein n=1 Tax=Gloeophyllum trabeum (strain ATCC 11539 / FP-39264 / Madison 617) TaxID=670483 RepID=S7PWS2_GLOTA|nr:uncharacterized protein GLOTRDRAFT_96086 [Gloeophyllum trabeum ATCC 11539]EPQ51837.1 hypothetical protein GLOTRDRAFT_96086 [Gloeophyllum trabeum ATCC 11539]
MAEESSVSELFVDSPLPTIYLPPYGASFQRGQKIAARDKSVTAQWANVVLPDYRLHEKQFDFQSHPRFPEFRRILKDLTIAPQTLAITSKFIASEGSTVLAVESQLLHPLWQLLELNTHTASKATAKNKNISISQCLQDAALPDEEVFIQLQSELWSGKNPRDMAGGVRADMIFSVLFFPKDFRETRGMKKHRQTRDTMLLTESPFSAKEQRGDTSDSAKHPWEPVLLPYEVKCLMLSHQNRVTKLGQIDMKAVKDIADHQIALGGTIRTGQLPSQGIKGIRSSLQQTLRYSVHYDARRTALGDYRNNLVLQLPSTIKEDLQKAVVASQRRGSGGKDNQGVRSKGKERSKLRSSQRLRKEEDKQREFGDEPGVGTSKNRPEGSNKEVSVTFLVGNISEENEAIPVLGSEAEGEPDIEDQPPYKRVKWMYAAEDKARCLLLFSLWLAVDDLHVFLQKAHNIDSKEKKDAEVAQGEASHRPQMVVSPNLIQEPEGSGSGRQ